MLEMIFSSLKDPSVFQACHWVSRPQAPSAQGFQSWLTSNLAFSDPEEHFGKFAQVSRYQ
jgi:hypothetical protein